MLCGCRYDQLTLEQKLKRDARDEKKKAKQGNGRLFRVGAVTWYDAIISGVTGVFMRVRLAVSLACR